MSPSAIACVAVDLCRDRQHQHPEFTACVGSIREAIEQAQACDLCAGRNDMFNSVPEEVTPGNWMHADKRGAWCRAYPCKVRRD